ncbi:MAG: UDP-N-acetylmuramoyl-tripeptide--D-alanyl-D-alanine ligase [bacterium]|jgi:UDP-N-acetylmuramoyl-tripeptide--D-alanyl-D-alanine ligase
MLTFQKIQEITGGEWITRPKNPDQILVGGAFDSRNITHEEIFFAWAGEQSDGHKYLSNVVGTSIQVAIVEQDVEALDGLVILKVPDSLKALHQMAHEQSQNFQGKIIALTGSAGKTTMKTWLGHVLSQSFSVLQPQGSFNNHIGCPITLLSLQPEHELVILEMGTSGIGELELLSSISPADITLLLNVGHAHLGKFGSIENTYKAKLEIFSYQRENGLCLIPANDSFLEKIKPKNKVYQTFGNGSEYSWKLKEINQQNQTQVFDFETSFGKKEVIVNQLGNHVGDLISALLIISQQLKIPLDDAISRLKDLPNEKGRSTLKQGIGNSWVLDDSYNANPESVVNMLQTICSITADEYIAVIGNLAELEDDLKQSADVILSKIPENLTAMYLGGETGKVLKTLIQEKYPKLSIYLIQDLSETIKELQVRAEKKVVFGVKGSRTSHMERVVFALEGKTTQCNLEWCGKLMSCGSCASF